MKKFLLLFILASLPLSVTPALAKKELVNITPVEKITTANDKVMEGDYVNFKIVNTDKILRGLVVKYEPNGMLGNEAILVIDQLYDTQSGEKYTGTLALNGSQHNEVMEYLTWFDLWARGGEVTILPDKDVFGLWREE